MEKKWRIIEDYSPPAGITPDLIYATDKYWYNNFSMNLGVEKQFDLSQNIQMNFGLNFSNYYTFSRCYHITNSYPTGNDFKQKNNRYFGFSAFLNGGLQKKIKKAAVGPEVILPIFDKWKKDKIFPGEENSEERSIWLKGIGVGIRIIYFLREY